LRGGHQPQQQQHQSKQQQQQQQQQQQEEEERTSLVDDQRALFYASEDWCSRNDIDPTPWGSDDDDIVSQYIRDSLVKPIVKN
jgi:transcription initiation factor TFIID subunit TAF12